MESETDEELKSKKKLDGFADVEDMKLVFEFHLSCVQNLLDGSLK